MTGVLARRGHEEMEAEAAVLPLYAKGRWPSPEAKRDKEELSLTGFREREREPGPIETSIADFWSPKL